MLRLMAQNLVMCFDYLMEEFELLEKMKNYFLRELIAGSTIAPRNCFHAFGRQLRFQNSLANDLTLSGMQYAN
jgi:hypothetical protein